MSQENITRTQAQPLRNPLNLRNLTNNTFSMFDVRNWYNIWAESVQNDEIVENADIRPVATVRSCPLCLTNADDMRLTLRPAEYEGSPCFVCARTPEFIEPGQTGGWVFVPDIREFVDDLGMEVGSQTPSDEQHPPDVEGQSSPVVERQTPQDETTTATPTPAVPKTKTAAKSSTVRKSPKTSKPTKRKAASPASKNTKK